MATPEAAAEKPTPVARRNPNKGFVATKEQADANRSWWVVDAAGKSLGRLASAVAHVIRGKHKPTFSPHLDVGDFVIVVNADKIKLTGNKLDQKLYSHHSGIPGGLKQESARRVMGRKPVFPVEKAVKGMLPKNVLGRAMFTKLKVYATPDHPHAAQKPQVLEIK